MDLLEILGYISASLIGISLGLIGGGGSILTVPVLVYLMGIAPVPATAYSLFIVGFSSLIGAGKYSKKQLVSYKTAIVFGIPSLLAVFMTRKFLVPAIPENIFTINDFIFTKDIALMVLFALLMIMASISMIMGKKETEEGTTQQEFK
ncbi:MAG TPA: TSUP family transporter, partial [Roseivirga sp.]